MNPWVTLDIFQYFDHASASADQSMLRGTYPPSYNSAAYREGAGSSVRNRLNRPTHFENNTGFAQRMPPQQVQQLPQRAMPLGQPPYQSSMPPPGHYHQQLHQPYQYHNQYSHQPLPQQQSQPSIHSIDLALKEQERKNRLLAMKVDRISAFMFPAVFTIFNVCYWTFYLATSGKDEWPAEWGGADAVTKT